MIKNHRAVLRTLAAAAAAVVLGTTQAQAQTTYNYSQQFGALGSVTGQFTGTDGDSNGLLDASEVSIQSMTFSGGLGSLSYGAADVYILGFQWVVSDTGGITNPSSGFDLYGDNGSGIAMNWVAGDYVGLDSTISSGILYLSDAATGVPTGTFEATGLAMVALAPVAPVPEPESYLMMAIGLAGIFAAKRRKLI
jgi:ABC-type amino acid transport substrate-binding protein